MVLLTAPQYVMVVVHPSAESPGFWRWAVHLGDDWQDQASCLNAGAAEDRDVAALRGQAVAVAVARLAERAGLLAGGDTVYLDHDPIETPWPIARVEEI